MTKHDAERKVKILDFIAATLRARGFPPSVREIARAVGLASTSAVHHHLQILEREGYLERGAAQSRAIRLTPTAAIRLGLTSELVPQATTGDARVVPIIGVVGGITFYLAERSGWLARFLRKRSSRRLNQLHVGTEKPGLEDSDDSRRIAKGDQ